MTKAPNPTAQKILILGGTKEAVELASSLISEGHDVTTSLAGRTKEPKPIEGNLRVGGFSKGFVSGAMGLANYLESQGFDLVIDATHPFAKQISENVKLAASLSGVDLQIKTRKPWIRQRDDLWLEVANLEEAKTSIPKGAKVLLALGSKYIDIFEDCFDIQFLVRMVDEPLHPLRLPNHTLLLGLPQLEATKEMAILEENKITHIVCRNSGGKGAYAKIEAARTLKLPVIIINQQI